MPITDLLERNAHEFCHETALVEINPEVKEIRRVTWKEYELIESSPTESYRREITWGVFDEKANRCANLLLSRGIKKGDKVAILMMNSLEWLPLYFGILKTGALAVPLNFRYTAEEIKYCLELADVDALFFGPEFIGRVEDICDQIPRVKLRFFIRGEPLELPAAHTALRRRRRGDILLLRHATRRAYCSPTTTTRRYTSPPERRASRRRYSTRTARSCTPRRSSRPTMVRRTTTSSSAYRRSTTPARRCTGSAASYRAAKA